MDGSELARILSLSCPTPLSDVTNQPLLSKAQVPSWVQLLMPVILATQEAEIKRITV
jgi:hypothetical protein